MNSNRRGSYGSSDYGGYQNTQNSRPRDNGFGMKMGNGFNQMTNFTPQMIFSMWNNKSMGMGGYGNQGSYGNNYQESNQNSNFNARNAQSHNSHSNQMASGGNSNLI